MKKLVIYMLLFCASVATAQNENSACMGWHNPTNFTSTGSTASYSGLTGSKASQSSTCSTWGTTGTLTEVSAANLATIQSSQSCRQNNESDCHNRFAIKSAGYAPETGNALSYLPPDTSFVRSIRIGNFVNYAEWECLTYTFTVSAQNALFTVWYALSLENALHSVAQNPEFAIHVEVQDPVTQNWSFISDTFCFVQNSPPNSSSIASYGFQLANGVNNVYRPWNKVVINLYKYLYRNVRISMASGDCSASGHYGCSYVAGDCEPMMLSASGCAAGESDFVGTIYAPRGMNHYTWYRSNQGELTSEEARNNPSNYTPIASTGQTHDTNFLGIELQHFITTNGDTAACNTFKCVLQSEMNPGKPINSVLFTQVCNTKPILALDSVLYCDGEVILTDRSQPLQISSESDRVDTANTQWTWYDVPNPRTVGAIAVATSTGGTSSHTYTNQGAHSVIVRSTAFDTTCWNQKTVQIRSLKPMTPVIEVERNNLCAGDTINLSDQYRQGSIWRKWHLYNDNGLDTIIIGEGANAMRSFNFVFTHTTTVELTTHNNNFFRQDTNLDGTLDPIYCDATVDTVIYVEQYPQLIVTGDTIVCMGQLAEVTVSSDVENCTYEWARSLNGSTFQTQQTMSEYPSTDMQYYVKVTSPFGCSTWDSLAIRIVDPTLKVPITEICEGHSVTLMAGNAASYTWTATPGDASLEGQEGNDTIIVTPSRTTTYTVVGHGTNGCNANPLTSTITVYPYPILNVEMTPTFIDSEEPNVTFRDASEYGVASSWVVGETYTTTQRQFTYTFTDINKTEERIDMTSYNQLGCQRDTTFYVPIQKFSIWFPNAITPTLSTNRTFRVFTGNTLEHFSLYIYNRKGQLLWSTHDQQDEWDGTYKDEYVDAGTYVYTCTYRREGTNDIVNRSGTIQVIH